MKLKLISLFISIWVLGCMDTKETTQAYKNQIGDTTFDANKDRPTFKFCDSTNVLHKRALVKYNGGLRALEQELIANYKFKPSYELFSGYIIIRFSINCQNERGRYRSEVLDSKFNLTKCPDDLESHVVNIFKRSSRWNHPIYENQHYDGYTFYNVKITNGKIEKS